VRRVVGRGMLLPHSFTSATASFFPSSSFLQHSYAREEEKGVGVRQKEERASGQEGQGEGVTFAAAWVAVRAMRSYRSRIKRFCGGGGPISVGGTSGAD
jgi:hypothetical protein